MGEELGCVAGSRPPVMVTAQQPKKSSPLSAWPAPAHYGLRLPRGAPLGTGKVGSWMIPHRLADRPWGSGFTV